MSQLLLEAWLYSWAIIEYVSAKCMRTRGESLHWCHNDHDGVSNHQPHGFLLNRLFRRRSKKKIKVRVTGLCVGNSPRPVKSPHKEPVTRKMFPFDDVIMWWIVFQQCHDMSNTSHWNVLDHSKVARTDDIILTYQSLVPYICRSRIRSSLHNPMP